jgi:cytochrome c-type biogenesis protein CcsB
VVNETLSQLSNALIYSAMLVYTIAFVAFAVDLSGRGRVAAAALDQAALDKAALDVEPKVIALPVSEPVAVGASSVHDHAERKPPLSPAVIMHESGSIDRSTFGSGRRRAAGIAVTLTYLAFALHLGAVIARGLSVDRAPWGNMYEFSISGTVVVTGVFLLVLIRQDLRFLGTFVIGPVLLSLGLATAVLYTDAAQLLPALQSFWLVIHVSVAFIASALFTLGFSLTLIQLVQERREIARAKGRPPRRGRFMDVLPSSVELESNAYRINAIAFPLWSFTLIAGAIWAEKAWSSYWSWDPKEVWSFVIWVVYAAYLHARATQGYRGRKAAYLALVGFSCVLFNYLVVNFFFIGFHSYAGVG